MTLGRNAPCPCGSGRKVKQCCGRLPAARAAAGPLAAATAAAAAAPHDLDARLSLGLALRADGRLEAALEHLAYAADLAPADAGVQAVYGQALFEARRHGEAIPVLARGTSAPGDLGDLARETLATALASTGRHAEAETQFRLALQRRPHAGLYANLGLVLTHLGRTDEALPLLEQAVAQAPEAVPLLANLAAAYVNAGRPADAGALHDRLARLAPHDASHASNRLFALNLRDDLSADAVAAEHRAYGEALARRVGDPRPRHGNDRRRDRVLRVGFVSSDLRQHSVAAFLLPVWPALDRAAVEVVAYADVQEPDAVTAALRASADAWIDVARLDDAALARRIVADRIDVLVDLNGHAGVNRLATFARRPAPVQVSWLGYPNTTGLAAIGYRLGDAVADPPGAEAHFVERLVRLPDGFLCWSPPPAAPPVAAVPPSRAAGHVTFGSFNQRSKVGPATVASWSRVLHAVPGSRLMLKNRWFDGAGGGDLAAAFARHGIGTERLVLMPFDADPGAHLGRYGAMDLALDPYPYTGTTTTCEALWMGVPVLTRTGDTHASRASASVLAQVGLHDCIATDDAALAAAAARWAADADRRAALRATLRERMRASPLMDAPGFARRLERAFRVMWHAWCDGAPA